MDFKWLLIMILLIFGAVIYFNEDLQGLGGATSGSEKQLDTLESKLPQPPKEGGSSPP